ncbi:MAG: carboxy terminal-processing peptidase [Saprospiraceae bacterium]|nr:carboxy terminal-processing peptidase [Saprospiraceae bacterium]
MTKPIWKKTLAVFFCFNTLFLLLGLRVLDAPGDKYDQTLHALARAIQGGHYSPKNYDDKLSLQIYDEFLKRMDSEKNIFIQSDIASFSKYKLLLDDELNGESVAFFYEVMAKYKIRIGELQAEYPVWFKSPFSFQSGTKEVYLPVEKDYPGTLQDRSRVWSNKIKYLVLEKYVDFKDNREASKIDSIKSRTDAELEAEARKLTQSVIKKILDQYNTQNSDDEFFSLYLNSIVNIMDPHTDYFLPVEKRSWDESISGKFYGIGAQIGEENGYLRIASVSVGGPAWRSGEVETGDIILKVAQGEDKPVDIAGFSIPDGVKLIRGANKSVVSLTMKKMDGTIKVINLVREELKIEETFARSNILNIKNKKIGIINLPKFYTNFGDDNGRSCADDVAKELERLKANQVDGIIMDLRGNGGGSLQEVVNMVGLFISQGPVVQVKGRSGKPGVYMDRDNKIVYDGPLSVLVNEFSASASEIFAAAIQDYKRGLIIGSGTYGKGSVQRPYNLNTNQTSTFDLGSVHITMQKYYRVNGESVQLKGVEPDLKLNGYYENYKVKEKDQPTALPWDQLGKLQYNTWTSHTPDIAYLKTYLGQLDTAQSFRKFEENSRWLAAQNDEPKIISEEAYRSQVKSIREKSAFNRTLMRVSEDLDIYGILEGETVEKSRIDRNNRLTNYYKRDHYLQLGAEVMIKWIQSKPLDAATNN